MRALQLLKTAATQEREVVGNAENNKHLMLFLSRTVPPLDGMVCPFCAQLKCVPQCILCQRIACTGVHFFLVWHASDFVVPFNRPIWVVSHLANPAFGNTPALRKRSVCPALGADERPKFFRSHFRVCH